MRNIGYVIELLRKERGLSQVELARLLKCTRQTVSNYERDFRRPDYDTLDLLASIFHVPISYFLTQDEMETELSKAKAQAVSALRSEDEERLLNLYRAFNRKGREMMLSMAESLSMNPDMLEKENSQVG